MPTLTSLAPPLPSADPDPCPAPSSVRAAAPPATTDPQVIKDYRHAARLVEDDAQAAYAIAKTLPPFARADAQRVELLAATALASGRPEEAAPLLEQVADALSDREAAYATRIDAAEMLILQGKASKAKALLTKLYKDRRKLRGRYATRRHLRARVIRLLHDIKLHQGDARGARAHALELLVFHPAEAYTLHQGLVLAPDALSATRRFARAKNLYGSWAYKGARAAFRPFLEDKNQKRRQSAKWHLAEIAMKKLRDDYPTAQRYYQELSRDSPFAEAATFAMAQAAMRQEDYDAALRHLDQYEVRYPKGRSTELVYYYRGWLPYDHRQNTRAIEGLTRYIDRYGMRGRRSSYVYGFLAWAHMREQHWREAIEVWTTMTRMGNPIVAGKALYWKAFAQTKLDPEDKDTPAATLASLHSRYPISYYDILGQQLLARIQGRDPRASQLPWPSSGGTYTFAPRVKVALLDTFPMPADLKDQWLKVRELAALGEERLAREALDPIYTKILALTPASRRQEWVHALGVLVGNYHEMWRLGAKSSISYLPPIPDPDPLRSVMAYPRAYDEVVESVAREFKLPPYLLWAIMRQESRYKPSAISHTDAVGALQMIPKTARLVARDLGTVYNPRTFHYPEVGFRFSGFYMRKLLDTFDGLFVPMAASYNSGPAVVTRWFRKNPQASFPWLIEEFEYNEGRAYCRKVTEHMLRYLYLYEKDPKRRGALLDAMFPLSRDISLPEEVGY